MGWATVSASCNSPDKRSTSCAEADPPGRRAPLPQSEAANGMTLEDASLAMDGSMLHVTTGPATSYWNASHTATGDYTVTATFTEPRTSTSAAILTPMASSSGAPIWAHTTVESRW